MSCSQKLNSAHKGLGRLQQIGLLYTIITQNIDDLHQQGGVTRVIEYHSNYKTLFCLWCNPQYRLLQPVLREFYELQHLYGNKIMVFPFESFLEHFLSAKPGKTNQPGTNQKYGARFGNRC